MINPLLVLFATIPKITLLFYFSEAESKKAVSALVSTTVVTPDRSSSSKLNVQGWCLFAVLHFFYLPEVIPAYFILAPNGIPSLLKGFGENYPKGL